MDASKIPKCLRPCHEGLILLKAMKLQRDLPLQTLTSVLRRRTEHSRIGFDRKDCASAIGKTVAPSSAYGSAVVETKKLEASS
ncbi:hypothetical protein AMTR_s00072p00149870 [Amborella trichopoda]|uniref:Uncharacterized protein n=1 Tax=Amborella trichopoda TaxID=13333 RepID=W1NS58_AMBTC|nr:hypothetical protein AMTR_s00072p00149870 [Amborella trichopoda]